MLIGFFMPTAGLVSAGSDDLAFEFVLPGLLLDPDAPPPVRVMLGLAVVAGLAAVVLGMMRYTIVRPAVLILLPVALSVLGFAAGGVIAGQLPGVHLPGLTAGRPVVLGINVVGAVILLIGIRILTYRHHRESGMPIAVIGGCMYLVSLLIPLFSEDARSAMLAAPFTLLSSGRAETIKLGLCMLLEVVGSLAALCVVASATDALARRKRLTRARMAFWCWTLAKVGTLSLFLLVATNDLDRPMVVAVLINIAGMLACGGGLVLMVIVGIVDAVVGPERSAPARPAPGAARCKSPLPPAPAPPIAPGTIAARRESPPATGPQSENEELQ